MNARTFDDRPATRERLPCMMGLTGPSGSGKTRSALRLATGMQRVTGNEIFVIDTEARRSLLYADLFKFRHVDFGAPFGSLDYLAAIEHCVKKGAGVVIIDSASHEHEGPGGMLEAHDAETKRIAQAWNCKLDKAQMAAWGKPKRDRRTLINSVMQMPCSFIFCFRAKDKLELKAGQDPKHMGYMAISGDEFIFELTVNALLLPGSMGVPIWKSNEKGERRHIKTADWAERIFHDGKQLDEEMGFELAKFVSGSTTRSIPELLAAYAACAVPAELGALESERRILWNATSPAEKVSLRAASEAAKVRLAEPEAPPEDDEAWKRAAEAEERAEAERQAANNA